jgi:putative ABC transport system permease protein
MTTADLVSTALSNVGRRKIRSFLASLGVVVGTLTIVLLISLATGVRTQINRQFELLGLDRLTVRPSAGGGGRMGGPFGGAATGKRTKIITPAEVTRWKALPGVAKVTPEVDLPGSITLELSGNGRSQPVALPATQNQPMNFLTTQPGPLAGSLELPDEGGLVASQGALQALGFAPGDFAGLVGQMFNVILRTPRGETQAYPLRLSGISASASRNPSVQISPANRIAMKSWWFNKTDLLETEGYDVVTVRTTDVRRAHELTPVFKKEGFQVQPLEVIVDAANRIVVAITVMLSLLASVALVVATIGIANTMVMAIYERTREIGVLKAMGASSAEIRRLFMIEAGAIGLVGGVFGLLGGWLAGVVLNQGIVWFFRSRDTVIQGNFFIVTLALAAGTIAFATAIGVFAGLLPARRAANLDPLVALRHE